MLCDRREPSYFERLYGQIFVRFNFSNNRNWDVLSRNRIDHALRVYTQFMAERGSVLRGRSTHMVGHLEARER